MLEGMLEKSRAVAPLNATVEQLEEQFRSRLVHAEDGAAYQLEPAYFMYVPQDARRDVHLVM